MDQNPNYQIATILCMAGVIFTCYLPANITAFLIVVTGYIEAQMLSLTEELLHLWEDAESHYYVTHQTNAVLEENIENTISRNKVINDYIESHLKDIIKTHGRNINLLHQVESVYSGAIALEFVILGVGLIAELLGGLENTYLEIPFALAQVGMDCFTGQRVMDASLKFERAVYDCKWENYNLSNMKIVLMMLQNSQKTMKFTNYIYVYVISGIWFVFWRCYKTGDLGAAMIVFSLMSTSEVALIKLFYMIFYEEKFKNLIDKYLACDSRTVKGSRFSKNLRKALRNVKMRGIICWLVLNMNAVLYVLRPMVTPGQHLTVDAFVILGLEPMFKSPNYELAVFTTMISVFFICFTVANVTCFLIMITGYTESQMLALAEEMIHIWDDANEYYQTMIEELSSYESVYLRNKKLESVKETEVLNEYVAEHLKDIIQKHSFNVTLLEEIEDVMRGPNAVGFLFLIVGLIAELLGGLNNTILQVPFTLSQLGTDCFLGQKIMDANIKFEEAVYACKWENFNKVNKKIVLVMLQNSQKTMTLTAGGMATLSFSYFMNIIRSTYSAYTTLRSTI
ncbi:hypothetical protein HF086_015543 [Spodoptera exigua]|uniref:Odorant receptor n=1 Tax=Spodoptera exigua TaxID=7107 RepID=A0A922MFY8_SPOEX|nr:hypothetical protein HF086_015543 [Spodoptera exigua]